MADKRTFKAPVKKRELINDKVHWDDGSWGETAFRGLQRRMDPAGYARDRQAQWLGSKAQEQALLPDYGLMSMPKDLAAGVGQYAAGEVLGALELDPLSLAANTADAAGVPLPYLAAAGGMFAGGRKLRQLGKAAAAEAQARRGVRTGLLKEVGPKGKFQTQSVDSGLLAKASPQMKKAIANMSELERSKVLDSEDTLRGAEDLLQAIPQHYKMAAVMKAGEAKKGWYQASAQALLDVFGMDAPRFAALLAATSPKTSVESNLKNALSIWVNWDKAGRPQDASAIKAIMGSSVQGTNAEKSVLQTWVNNTVTALSATNPAKITLSGPKVDSFMLNLVGDSRRVTLDAWMANGLGMAQDIFSGRPTALQQAAGNPGITPDYAVVSAQMRRAGKLVGMSPAEAQETFWSVVMPLYEGARRKKMSAQEYLDRGLFTNRDVRGTPDFSSLFKTGESRNVLERGGYGQRLDAMKSYVWPEVNLDAAPSLNPKQQQYLMEFAKILDGTQNLRRTESRAALVPKPGQDEVFANSTFEYIGGANSGVGNQTGVSPNILRESAGRRKNFSDLYNNAMTNLRGQDTLLSSVFGNRTTSVRPTTGMFDGPGGLENQPAFSASTSVRHVVGPDGMPAMHPDDLNALRAVERTRGILTQQHGTPFNAIVASKNPLATSGFITRPKKTDIGALQAARAVDPTMAFADTGLGVAALDVGDGTGPMTRQKLKDLKNVFADAKVAPEAYPGFNIGEYVNNQPGWLDHPMGSGFLTDQWLQEVDAMPKSARRGLETGLQTVAQRIRRNVLPRLSPGDIPRQDVQNFIDISAGEFKDPQFNPTGAQIIEAMRKARKAGVALPALGAGVGLSRGLLSSDDEERNRY